MLHCGVSRPMSCIIPRMCAVLNHPTPQAVRQTVRIVSMDHPQGILRTGDRATVTFEFISHPEFIKEGMKLLFREGKTKVRSSLHLLPSPSFLPFFHLHVVDDIA